jgi:hypothetical protein
VIPGAVKRLHLIFAAVLAAAFLAFAPGASAANLSMVVTFSASGNITVTLPDGTPVGVTSGSPTVIPAGFYTMDMVGPGGCSTLPYFDLRGPGNSILDNMDQGEESQKTLNATFLPNSTYTWRDDQFPSVVYTFQTNSTVLGTAPAAPVASQHGEASSSSIIASETNTVPSRGVLTGTITAAGKLTLSYQGKSVGSLQHGKYTFKVTDRSSSHGFLLQKVSHKAFAISGVTFVGKRTATVNLTAGTWIFTPKLGEKAYTVTVTG